MKNLILFLLLLNIYLFSTAVISFAQEQPINSFRGPDKTFEESKDGLWLGSLDYLLEKKGNSIFGILHIGPYVCVSGTVSKNLLASLNKIEIMQEVRKNGYFEKINFLDAPPDTKDFYASYIKNQTVFPNRPPFSEYDVFRGTFEEYFGPRRNPNNMPLVMEEWCIRHMDTSVGATSPQTLPAECKKNEPTTKYKFPTNDGYIQNFADINGLGWFDLPQSKTTDARLFLDKSYKPSVGHRYTVINELGKSNLCPSEVMDEIKKNLDKAFPIFTATGRDQRALKLNSIYDLNLKFFGYTFNNPVKVIDVKDFYFTFLALPEHSLVGTATHGIIKDQNGVLWMFQEGTGQPDKESFVGMLSNNIAAGIMWEKMVGNVKDMMKGIQPRKDLDRCTCSLVK